MTFISELARPTSMERATSGSRSQHWKLSDGIVSGVTWASIGRFTKVNGGQHRTVAVTRNFLKTLGVRRKALERATGIEPAFSAWEADVLPLNYARAVANVNA